MTVLGDGRGLEIGLARPTRDHSRSVQMPSPGEIDKIKKLADAVDKLTVTANTYAKAVNMAAQALDAYAKIRSA